jgi:hypothetical protein
MQIQEIVKGDKSRTMMHAKVANELIKAINSVLTGQIIPAQAGSIQADENSFVINLSVLQLTVCVDGKERTAKVIGWLE